MNRGHPDQERQGQVPAFLVQSHGLVSGPSLVLSDHSTIRLALAKTARRSVPDMARPGTYMLLHRRISCRYTGLNRASLLIKAA